MTTDPYAWDFDTRVGAQSTPSSSSSPDVADSYNRRALRAIAALADACWTEPELETPEIEAELDQLDALLAAAEKLPLAAGGGHLRVVHDLLACEHKGFAHGVPASGIRAKGCDQ